MPQVIDQPTTTILIWNTTDNNIGDAGIAEFKEALEMNSTLSELDLSSFSSKCSLNSLMTFFII